MCFCTVGENGLEKVGQKDINQVERVKCKFIYRVSKLTGKESDIEMLSSGKRGREESTINSIGIDKGDKL